MPVPVKSWVETLGPLRSALLALAVVNMLLPITDALLEPLVAAGSERSLWTLFATLITPVMAPLLFVVLLFDYIMSRVRAADAVDEERARFVLIGRIELTALAIMLIYWVPALLAMTR